MFIDERAVGVNVPRNSEFQEVADRLGLPDRIKNHPRINFNKFEDWLKEVSTMTANPSKPLR